MVCILWQYYHDQRKNSINSSLSSEEEHGLLYVESKFLLGWCASCDSTTMTRGRQ
jgi:hypothetical protein